MNALSDRLPPHNLRAEQSVLGSILLNNEVAVDVLEVLCPEDFYRDIHQVVFRAIREMVDKALPVDVVTLPDYLTAAGAYAKIGGDDFLTEIVNAVPHPLDARFYADIVRDKAISRAIIEAAGEMQRDAYSLEHTSEVVLERTYARLDGLGMAGNREGARPISEFIREAFYRALSRLEGEFSGDGMETGLADLDHIIGGLRRGTLVILAARPSMGKSALALQIAENAPDGKVLFFSLEMPGVEIAERFLVGRSKVSAWAIREGKLGGTEPTALGKVYEDSLVLRDFYLDEEPSTMARISSLARRHKQKHGLNLLVIDYLQLVDPGEDAKSQDNRQAQVQAMSRRLKILAKELDCPVLCLAQLNRESEKRRDRRPQLSDLRESGALEQDADLVLLLHRPSFYDPNDQPGVADLIIAKNRSGPTSGIKLTFLADRTRFENHSPVEDFR